MTGVRADAGCGPAETVAAAKAGSGGAGAAPFAVEVVSYIFGLMLLHSSNCVEPFEAVNVCAFD